MNDGMWEMHIEPTRDGITNQRVQYCVVKAVDMAF